MSADSSADIEFGGCDGKIANCLPTTVGWNYMVRLYRPSAEILNGTLGFPGCQRAVGRERQPSERGEKIERLLGAPAGCHRCRTL